MLTFTLPVKKVNTMQPSHENVHIDLPSLDPTRLTLMPVASNCSLENEEEGGESA